MKSFPDLTIPLIFTNLMILASCIFTVANVTNSYQKRKILNAVLNNNANLDIKYEDYDLKVLNDQVNSLRNRLISERQIRDNLIQQIHGLGLNHVGLNERGEINLSLDDISRITGMGLIIDQVELNRIRTNEIEREIVEFVVRNPRVVNDIIRKGFFVNGIVNDSDAFMLAINCKFLHDHSPYMFSRQLVLGPIIDAGWKHMYHDIVVERPENFREGSRLYRELEQLFPWPSHAASRDTFAQNLSHSWGSNIRYRMISDSARNTLAIIVRLLNDPNALTQQQRENILAVAKLDIENHDDACQVRTESIITNMTTIIDQTFNVNIDDNIHNVRELSDLILSSWRKCTILNGSNEHVGVHTRNAYMRYLSAGLNIPYNGLREGRFDSYATVAGLLVDRNILSINSICCSAQMTFASINDNALLENLHQSMLNIPIKFSDFKKCILTYDKYNLDGLIASAEQYEVQRVKTEILQEVMDRRRVPVDEQNNRSERIKIAVENAIINSLRNFSQDIQNLPDGDRRNEEINVIAQRISDLIQMLMPVGDLENLGFGIVNRAINTAKDNTFRNIDVNDNQRAVINRAIKMVNTLQNRRGSALQEANRQIEQNYAYNLPQEVRRIDDAKRNIRNLIANPNATFQSRLERYMNNYLADNADARNTIQNWMNGRENKSMRQIIEVLPNIEMNKYLIPEFVPFENPNVYRANILYPVYLVSRGYIFPQ